MKAYREAGVDLAAAESVVERIKPLARRTTRPEVLGGLGGFGGLFQLDLQRFPDPVLVSGTDGVGTKLLLAREIGQHQSIGIDLVAMCVNDIVVHGAEPLFFLDYLACGVLRPEHAASVVEGISNGCLATGCSLLGGETAELPGMYPAGAYDLAGFAVGAVSRKRLIDGSRIKEGDALLGLASSGLHSNGFSLARRIIREYNLSLRQRFNPGNQILGEALLEPTRIYVKAVLALMEKVELLGMAHITGGGLLGNVPRMLPPTLLARVDRNAWPEPPLHRLLRESSGLPLNELDAVFNQGIGFVICVREEDSSKALESLTASGETAFRIGDVAAVPSAPVAPDSTNAQALGNPNPRWLWS